MVSISLSSETGWVGFFGSTDGRAAAAEHCRGVADAGRAGGWTGAAASSEHICIAEWGGGAIAHHANEDVAVFFRLLDAAGAHEGAVVSEVSMQGQNQRGLLAFDDF
jgi:hypothetical protein